MPAREEWGFLQVLRYLPDAVRLRPEEERELEKEKERIRKELSQIPHPERRIEYIESQISTQWRTFDKYLRKAVMALELSFFLSGLKEEAKKPGY